MMRNWILEDATPYIDTDNIAYPVDWPFWDQRHELATQSVLPDDQGGDDLDGPSMLFSIAPAPKKPASTDDKVLRAFEESADPLGLEVIYVHKDQIAAATGASDGTLSNALTRLTKAGKVHRQVVDDKEVRGMYGIGPAPADSTDTD